MTSEAFDRVREALASHGSRVTGNRQGEFKAQCPHHEDGDPSLNVTDKGDRVLLHCHAGCNNDDILRDLDLDLASLFDGEPSKDRALPIRSYLYEAANGTPWFWKDRYFPKTFICRLPGTDPGNREGLQGKAPVLYHLPQLIRGIAAHRRVWLVDGEKDVETLERAGEVATCPPSGTGARWIPQYTEALRGAPEVLIVVDQDKAKADGTLGSGQQHAATAREELRAVGVKVRLVAAAVGKDATDHFDGGYGIDDFVADKSTILRPRGVAGDDLITAEFDPLVYCVKDVLPSGLAILAGHPKAGKSWIALSMALGVACGGKAMSYLECTQGSVLYLAREDSRRRLQSRLELLMRGEPDVTLLKHVEFIAADEPWAGGPQGLAAMTEWAEEVGDPRLVIVDTLQKVENGQTDNRTNAYAADYSMMSQYKTWADHHDCTILMVHHLRKSAMGQQKNDDPFSEISGTRGITGVADTLLVLENGKRGERTGTLHITGRDVAEQSLELAKFGPLWTCIDMPDPV